MRLTKRYGHKDWERDFGDLRLVAVDNGVVLVYAPPRKARNLNVQTLHDTKRANLDSFARLKWPDHKILIVDSAAAADRAIT